MQLIIYLYISSILIFNSAFAETPKRAPLGFSAVRGKKSEPNYEYQNQNYLEEFLRNGDPSSVQSNSIYFSGIRNDPEADSEWVRVPYSALNNDGRSELWNGDDDDSSLGKRSPYGFVGVRGKKFSPSQGRERNDDSDVTSLRKKKEVEVFQYDRKRVPYAFLGMRGKKENVLSYYKAKDQYGDKRTPMGFIGMRGKKSYNGWATRDEKTG